MKTMKAAATVAYIIHLHWIVLTLVKARGSRKATGVLRTINLSRTRHAMPDNIGPP